MEDKRTIGFEQHTSMAENRDFDGYHFIKGHHYYSISALVKYDVMNYNYVLRLEKEDLWFPTFVKDFGLESTIDELSYTKRKFRFSLISFLGRKSQLIPIYLTISKNETNLESPNCHG